MSQNSQETPALEFLFEVGLSPIALFASMKAP